MNRQSKLKATQISAFVDGLILQRRDRERDEECLDNDGEFKELRALIEEIRDVRIDAPTAFQEELLTRLPKMDAVERRVPKSRWRSALGSLFRSVQCAETALRRAAVAAAPSAVVVVFAVAVLVVSRSIWDTPLASAAEVLSRSDAALAKLVHPGQLLYRRWKVTSTTVDPSGATTRRTVRMIHEWMDGGNFDRVAGRWYSSDDRLQIGYATVGKDTDLRPNVYFSPGVYSEPRGVLNIEPTVAEFRQAIQQFPTSEQSALQVYLDRQQIYEPIIGEVRKNRAIIETPHYGVSALPRIVLSLDRGGSLNGSPVYGVRVVDPAWIDFNWRSGGPPLVRLARLETVRFIDRDSYLSVKTEETLRFEDGRQRFTTRELVETKAVSPSESPLDPFKLEIPAGTPVQRQSAVQQLTGVADAFRRLPAFTAFLEHTQTHH